MTRSRALARQARTAIRKVRGVPRAEWPLVLQTFVVAVVVEVGLRTARLPALARTLGTPLGDAPEGPHQPDFAEVVARLPLAARRRLRISAQIMNHWPFDEKCLRRSLVAGYSIRRWQPHLVIGVAIVAGEVNAHAWLTVDGMSLDPWGSTSFSTLQRVSRR